MVDTQADRELRAAALKAAHLEGVMRARGAVIDAERTYQRAVEQAKAAGCDGDDVSMAVRMMNRVRER